MTPGDLKGPKPLRDLLSDVRTQMAALMVAVQALTAALHAPEQKRIDEAARTAAIEVIALRTDLVTLRHRVDSVARSAASVASMVEVLCLREREQLARQILQCTARR